MTFYRARHARIVERVQLLTADALGGDPTGESYLEALGRQRTVWERPG